MSDSARRADGIDDTPSEETRPPTTLLNDANPETQNPLAGMASILAIRDVRRRIASTLRENPDEEVVAGLLALDPLATLRCLRVGHAPINRVPESVLSIPALTRALGRPIALRALRAPVRDAVGTHALRQLWLHSVATAHAARSLAATSGACDPEDAYLLGLLHDLPLWLHHLGAHSGTLSTASLDAREWIDHWNLPEELHEVIDKTSSEDARSGRIPDGGVPGMIAGAELLAELADFWHPGDGDEQARRLMLNLVTKEDLVAAHNLRQEVGRSLGDFGLSTSMVEPDESDIGPMDDSDPFPVKSRGDVSEIVLSLLDCNQTNHYRSILTATTSACLRFLDFERVYYVQWIRETGDCVVRAKADLSPRRLEPTRVAPTRRELSYLELAHEENRPQHLVCLANENTGLLRLLGSSEVLMAPLNRDFDVPSFLIMDRALSGTPIDLAVDSNLARGLAGTATMLTENLMLKKLRERAEKYALTDPLTRLYNRTVGISTLEQEAARARRTGSQLTVLMLDIDDFKKLNDTRGHLVGDHALRQTADVLRKTLRRTDYVCRYGGEEFLVVLPETSSEEATISAARIFTAVADAGRALDLPLTISIGLARMIPEDTVESVLARADRALYASKMRGRNRFSVDVE